MKDFDHLVLLVGTNPLPNFVVAEYFIKKNRALKKIFLLYSEDTVYQKGTREFAENIAGVLLRRNPEIGPESIIKIPLSNISSGVEIERDVKRRLLEAYDLRSIHLNYTGGTKAMGIHTYKVLKELKGDNASFSYLDAKSFRILGDTSEHNYECGDLRREIEMRLEDILDLHSFRIKKDESEGINREIFAKALERFRELIDENRLSEYCESYTRKFFINNNRLIDEKKKITDELRTYKFANPLRDIILLLPEEYRICDQEGKFIEPADSKKLKYTIRFLDGNWLEQYVYNILQGDKYFSALGIRSNIIVDKAEWAKKNMNFEIDIIIVKGYQLIGFSLTVDNNRSGCKSKGFEILHRVRQIGGEEAKAVLITRLNESNVDGLTNELAIDTGGRGNILVLGEKDLKSEILLGKIKEFID